MKMAIGHFRCTCRGLRQAEPVVGADPLGSVNGTALAFTCRRFKEVYYSVVYGENHFTVEMATIGLTPHIFGSLPESGIDSQISLFEYSPDVLGPLSRGCAKYLKEITLLVSITSKTAAPSRFLLRERFQEMIKLFPSDHSLKRVTIDLRKVSEAPLHPLPERLGWNVYGKDDFALRLRDPMPLDTHCNMYAKFRESLGELLHVEDLLLSAGPNSNILEELVGTPKAPRPRKKRRLR